MALLSDTRYPHRIVLASPIVDEDDDERKALNFQQSDPKFRIFMCNFPVAPVFLIISIVKLVLLAALFFTIAQLILHSTSTISDDDDEYVFNFTSIISITSRRPKNLAPGDEGDVNGRSSWAASIFYFEPSWWFTLAYLRLTIAVVAILSVLCGLFGLWRQRRRFLLATAAADCGLILFLLGYMALLAWHAVKYDDYFAFCIGGLTLLSLLLISVMGLHAAVVTHKYLRSMQAFLSAAKNRWPDAYDESIRVVRRRYVERKRFISKAYARLIKRYSVVKELSRVTAAELAVMHRSGKMVLHDIEEAEENEEQRTL